MKFATAGLAIGLVSLTALSAATHAADMPGQRMGGGAYGQAAVPVPAPVPYEEHYKWYIGAGVGFSAKMTGNIAGTTGIDISPFEDQTGPVYGSIFAGRYLTPSLRVEFGMDFRAKQKVASGTPYNYSVTLSEAGAASVANPAVDTINYNNYDMTHSEKARVNTNTYMFNAYHEFMPGSRVRPYVGAGIGLATHHLTREMIESGTCSSAGNFDPATGIDIATGCHSTDALPTALRVSPGGSTTGFGLAASLMAGATVDLSARTHLDLGYRFMYMGSKTVVTLSDALGNWSTIDVGARKDHEVRTAIRFDLW